MDNMSRAGDRPPGLVKTWLIKDVENTVCLQQVPVKKIPLGLKMPEIQQICELSVMNYRDN